MAVVTLLQKARLKKNILNQIKSKKKVNFKKAALDAGYAPSSARNATQLQSVQQCRREIAASFRRETITVDYVLAELERAKNLAEKKEDIASYVRVCELLGKYLAMFTERQQVQTVSIFQHITDLPPIFPVDNSTTTSTETPTENSIEDKLVDNSS